MSERIHITRITLREALGQGETGEVISREGRRGCCRWQSPKTV